MVYGHSKKLLIAPKVKVTWE